MGKSPIFFFSRGKAHNLEIFIKNHNDLNVIQNFIFNNIDKNLKVIDWKKQNSTFINALNVEKNVMFLILSLIILVAAFNIISSMIMLVNTKQADIALLRTMGATKSVILKIFLLIGTSIGFLGTFLGSLIGIYLSINIETLRKIFIFYT